MSNKSFISFSDLPLSSMKASLRSQVVAGSSRRGASASSGDINSDKSYSSSTRSMSDVSPVYNGGNSELSMLSRKLLKKDVVTRVKAISQLIEAIKGRNEAAVEGFISFFNFAFARLVVVDNSVKVREGMVGLLRTLIDVSKKTVRQHIAHLLPLWWMCCADASPEVARAATEALSLLYPLERKRVEILLLPRHCTAVCAAIKETLQHTVASLQEVAAAGGLGEGEEAVERYERCIITAIRALRSLIIHTAGAQTTLPPSSPLPATSTSGGVVISPKLLDPIRDLLQEEGFWRRINSKGAGAGGAAGSVSLSVRLAMVGLLQITCDYNKSLLLCSTATELSSEGTTATTTDDDGSGRVVASSTSSPRSPLPSPALVKLCRVIYSQRLLLTPIEVADGTVPVSDAATSLCIQTWISFVNAYKETYWAATSKADGGKPRAVQLLDVLREQVTTRPALMCPWLVLIIATLPVSYTCGLCDDSAHLLEFISFLRKFSIEAATATAATASSSHSPVRGTSNQHDGGDGSSSSSSSARAAGAGEVSVRDHVNACVLEISTLLLLRKQPVQDATDTGVVDDKTLTQAQTQTQGQNQGQNQGQLLLTDMPMKHRLVELVTETSGELLLDYVQSVVFVFQHSSVVKSTSHKNTTSNDISAKRRFVSNNQVDCVQRVIVQLMRTLVTFSSTTAATTTTTSTNAQSQSQQHGQQQQRQQIGDAVSSFIDLLLTRCLLKVVLTNTLGVDSASAIATTARGQSSSSSSSSVEQRNEFIVQFLSQILSQLNTDVVGAAPVQQKPQQQQQSQRFSADLLTCFVQAIWAELPVQLQLAAGSSGAETDGAASVDNRIDHSRVAAELFLVGETLLVLEAVVGSGTSDSAAGSLVIADVKKRVTLLESCYASNPSVLQVLISRVEWASKCCYSNEEQEKEKKKEDEGHLLFRVKCCLRRCFGQQQEDALVQEQEQKQQRENRIGGIAIGIGNKQSQTSLSLSPQLAPMAARLVQWCITHHLVVGVSVILSCDLFQPGLLTIPSSSPSAVDSATDSLDSLRLMLQSAIASLMEIDMTTKPQQLPSSFATIYSPEQIIEFLTLYAMKCSLGYGINDGGAASAADTNAKELGQELSGLVREPLLTGLLGAKQQAESSSHQQGSNSYSCSNSGHYVSLALLSCFCSALSVMSSSSDSAVVGTLLVKLWTGSDSGYGYGFEDVIADTTVADCAAVLYRSLHIESCAVDLFFTSSISGIDAKFILSVSDRLKYTNNSSIGYSTKSHTGVNAGSIADNDDSEVVLLNNCQECLTCAHELVTKLFRPLHDLHVKNQKQDGDQTVPIDLALNVLCTMGQRLKNLLGLIGGRCVDREFSCSPEQWGRWLYVLLSMTRCLEAPSAGGVGSIDAKPEAEAGLQQQQQVLRYVGLTDATTWRCLFTGAMDVTRRTGTSTITGTSTTSSRAEFDYVVRCLSAYAAFAETQRGDGNSSSSDLNTCLFNELVSWNTNANADTMDCCFYPLHEIVISALARAIIVDVVVATTRTTTTIPSTSDANLYVHTACSEKLIPGISSSIPSASSDLNTAAALLLLCSQYYYHCCYYYRSNHHSSDAAAEDDAMAQRVRLLEHMLWLSNNNSKKKTNTSFSSVNTNSYNTTRSSTVDRVFFPPTLPLQDCNTSTTAAAADSCDLAGMVTMCSNKFVELLLKLSCFVSIDHSALLLLTDSNHNHAGYVGRGRGYSAYSVESCGSDRGGDRGGGEEAEEDDVFTQLYQLVTGTGTGTGTGTAVCSVTHSIHHSLVGKGSTLCYIDRNITTCSSKNTNPNIGRICHYWCERCVVVQVHTEEYPAQPVYYTIQVAGRDNEKQTEGHRLLLDWRGSCWDGTSDINISNSSIGTDAVLLLDRAEVESAWQATCTPLAVEICHQMTRVQQWKGDFTDLRAELTSAVYVTMLELSHCDHASTVAPVLRGTIASLLTLSDTSVGAAVAAGTAVGVSKSRPALFYDSISRVRYGYILLRALLYASIVAGVGAGAGGTDVDVDGVDTSSERQLADTVFVKERQQRCSQQYRRRLSPAYCFVQNGLWLCEIVRQLHELTAARKATSKLLIPLYASNNNNNSGSSASREFQQKSFVLRLVEEELSVAVTLMEHPVLQHDGNTAQLVIKGVTHLIESLEGLQMKGTPQDTNAAISCERESVVEGANTNCNNSSTSTRLTGLLLRALSCLFKFKAWSRSLDDVIDSNSISNTTTSTNSSSNKSSCASWEVLGLRFALSVLVTTAATDVAVGHGTIEESWQRHMACEVVHCALFYVQLANASTGTGGGTAGSGACSRNASTSPSPMSPGSGGSGSGGATGQGNKTKAQMLSVSAARSQQTAYAQALLAHSFCNYTLPAQQASLSFQSAAISAMFNFTYENKALGGVGVGTLQEDDLASLQELEMRLISQFIADSSASASAAAAVSASASASTSAFAPNVTTGDDRLNVSTPNDSSTAVFALTKIIALINDSSEFVLYAVFGHCAGNPTAARKGRIQQLLAQIAEGNYQEQYQQSLHGVKKSGSSSNSSSNTLSLQLMELVFGVSVWTSFMHDIDQLRSGHGRARGHNSIASPNFRLLFLWIMIMQRLSVINMIIAELHVKSYSSSLDDGQVISDEETELLELLLAVRGEALRLFIRNNSTDDAPVTSIYELILAHVVLCYQGNVNNGNISSNNTVVNVSELHQVLHAASSCACSGGSIQEVWNAGSSLVMMNAGVEEEGEDEGDGNREQQQQQSGRSNVLKVWRAVTAQSAGLLRGEREDEDDKHNSTAGASVVTTVLDIKIVQAFALLRTVLTCPTLFRRWYDDCEYIHANLKRAKPMLLRFVEGHVSSALISREMELITMMQREQAKIRAQRLEKKKQQKKLIAERLAKQAMQRGESGDGPAAPTPMLSAKARAVVEKEDEEQQSESLNIVGRTSAYTAGGAGGGGASSSAGGGGGTGSSGNSTGGVEICATYHRDDTTIELRIKLSAAYPLKNAEVEASSLLGIAKDRWQRWKLQIIQLLTNSSFGKSNLGGSSPGTPGIEGEGATTAEGSAHGGRSGGGGLSGGGSYTGGGSIIEAIQLWKFNIDKEFEGVEPCPICYSIVHISGATSTASNSSKFPSMECRTCHNKFHSVCLHQWFKSSGKSKCVICQQPFFGADS